MGAQFERAVGFVLEHEGGFVDDPADPGGATNWGITLPTLKGSAGGDVNGDGRIDGEDIRGLSREQAVGVYRELWERWGVGRFGDDGVARKFFDLAVNMGVYRAGICLQRALRATEHPVKVDGVVGPITIENANRAPAHCLVAALRSEAAGQYRLFVRSNPGFVRFARGWENRAYA